MRYQPVPGGRSLGLVGWLLPVALWPGLAEPESPRSLSGTVIQVVVGDTIHVRADGRVERVRYLGVNTPEVHHPTKGEQPAGREATEVNRHLVEGRTVGLELDVRERDRNGWLLAYVYVGETMVNAELVRLGYAQVMTVPPNVRHQEVFLKLQREAREAGRGLWARENDQATVTVPDSQSE